MTGGTFQYNCQYTNGNNTYLGKSLGNGGGAWAVITGKMRISGGTIKNNKGNAAGAGGTCASSSAYIAVTGSPTIKDNQGTSKKEVLASNGSYYYNGSGASTGYITNKIGAKKTSTKWW